MQGKQDPLPSVGFFDPGRHFKHVVVFSASPPRYSPTPQLSHPFVTEFSILPATQSLQAAAPAELLRPDGQSRQVVGFVSVVERYWFLPHSLHAVSNDAPASVPYFPGWQSMQVLSEVAPMALEYVPAVHLEQFFSATKPVSVLYMPAGHPLHVD
jgi:hypothetical protein